MAQKKSFFKLLFCKEKPALEQERPAEATDNDNRIPAPPQRGIDGEGETSILVRPAPADEGETTFLGTALADSEGETTFLGTAPADSEDDSPAPAFALIDSEDESTFTGSISPAGEGETSLLGALPPEALLPHQRAAYFSDTELTEADKNIYRSSGNLVLVRSSTGERFALSRDYLTLGKDCANVDIPLDNASISRHHATITRENGGWYLMDNKSTNGTTIEGVILQPYEKAELFDGAIFSLGDEYFQVLSE